MLLLWPVLNPLLGWRNWYTRKTKDLVPKGLRVRVPSRAPLFESARSRPTRLDDQVTFQHLSSHSASVYRARRGLWLLPKWPASVSILPFHCLDLLGGNPDGTIEYHAGILQQGAKEIPLIALDAGQ